MKLLSDRCMKKANDEGVIRTKKGRKCRFDMWEPKDFGIHSPETFENAVAKYGKNNIKRAFTYKALNRLIQGSAADMTKKAMVQLYERGILPQIQIHDELCLSIKDDKQKETIKNVMEKSLPLLIKNKVNCLTGSSWGDCKK